jgi:hypothetical protein
MMIRFLAWVGYAPKGHDEVAPGYARSESREPCRGDTMNHAPIALGLVPRLNARDAAW